MQNPAKRLSIRKYKSINGVILRRQAFNFGDGKRDHLVVEVSFHEGLKTWTAEAYYYGNDFQECHWAQVFCSDRKVLIRRLRMAVAIKRTPEIKKVNDALMPPGGIRMRTNLLTDLAEKLKTLHGSTPVTIL